MLLCDGIKAGDFASSNNDAAVASTGVADAVKQPAATDNQRFHLHFSHLSPNHGRREADKKCDYTNNKMDYTLHADCFPDAESP